MANDIKILIQAITKGERETRAFADMIDSGFKRGRLAADAFNAATGNGQKIVRNLQVGVKDLVGAFLGLTAAKAAFSGMIDILKKGEQAQFAMTSSVQAANREFQNTGSMQFWQNAVKDLSKELVVYSESALKGAVSRTIDMTKRLGLSAEEMRTVIARTADLSAGKTDLEGGIERVTAALRGEAEASEYLGLTLNENYVKAWHEAHNEHQKAWKDLTDVEKAQVRYRVFLEQTSATQGRAAESAKTFQGALMLVDKSIQDAVNNNKSLAEAMSEVAQFIRENADSIGDLASDLITLTAKVAQFALEWKEVFLGLGAIWGVAKAVTFLSTVITGLRAAMAVLRAASGAKVMLDMAAATTTARLAGVALSTWMTGFLAVAAAMAAQQVWRLVDAYMEMKKWEDAAKEASKTRLEVEDRANKKAQELGQRLGININSLADFNRLVKEGKLVWDDQTQSWKRAETAAVAQARTVELTEEKLKALKETIEDVGHAYRSVTDQTAKYFDFAEEKSKALSTDERKNVHDSIEIQRQKAETLLKLARDEADQKMEIIRQAGGTDKQQAELAKKVAEDLKNFRLKTLDDWLAKLQSSYVQALSEEKRYAEEVKRLKDARKTAEMETADMVRELARRTMSEEQAYLDKRKQAMETLAQAESMLARAKTPEALEKAEDLAKKAQDQFAALAGEVKQGDQVIRTEAQTVKEAIAGVQEAGNVLDKALKAQITAAETSRKNWGETAKEIETTLTATKAKIDEINNTPITPTATFQVDSTAVDTKLAELDGKVTHSTHIIHVQEVRESQSGGLIERLSGGGWPRRSGKLPGWGGGDRIRALLEAGEYVVRKEAVAKYGVALFQALNNMRLNLLDFFRVPALPETPRLAYAAGGMASPGADYGTLTLRAGEVELPVMVPGPGGREMVREFERELRKMRLTRGR